MSTLEPRPVYLHAAAASHPGCRREENQDNFLIADLSIEPDAGGLVLVRSDGLDGAVREADFLLGSRGALLLVADGMGGAAAGSVASRIAAEAVHTTLRANDLDHIPDPHRLASRLRDAVATANTIIHSEAQVPGREGMGTTLTAVGVVEDVCFVAQVGDSRAYLVRGGDVRQLTRDQSLGQQMVDSGAMTLEEAEGSRYSHVLLQALGTEPVVRVEVTYQTLRRDDVLVVCSDGLFRVVRAEEIAEACARLLDAALLCEHLVALANERGGPDNVTIVAVRFGGSGLEMARAGDPVGWQAYPESDD